MSDIKRILVPVNGTEESLKALDIAAELAQLYDARIDLLLVTYFSEETDSNISRESWLPNPLTGSVSKYIQAVFTKAYSLLPKNTNLRVDKYHLSGRPQVKILEFAKEHDVDVIIMGCRNLSFISSLLNGSISRHILEKSACPVIIVK